MSEKGFRIEIPVHIKRDRRARKVLETGDAPEVQASVPRIARLLALAHKWEGMVRRGDTNCGEIARLHGLSNARVTQVCSLVLLAPEIQALLIIGERLDAATGNLRCAAGNAEWNVQRRSVGYLQS